MEIINPDGTPAAPQSHGAPPAGGDVVKDSDTAHFAADVIEASTQIPVIVDFWAPWCGPCKQLGPMIEKLVRQAGGLVRLIKINVDENQDLAAQLRVQSIPAVFAFKGGRPVDGFAGALPESQIRAFIDRLLDGAKPPLEEALDQGASALEAGDVETARAIYGEVANHVPEDGRPIAGLLRCALVEGTIAEAREMIENLPPEMKDDKEVAAAIAAIDLAEQGSSASDTSALEERLAADPTDHQTRFDLAVALYGAGDGEAAVAALIEIVRRERTWNDDAARNQLLKIFEAQGPMDPVTVAGRRALSSILFS